MRATKGGQIGVNGEWYEGGQFLPSSQETIKGQQKVAKTEAKPTKQEIAPYKWEISNQVSIWQRVSPVCIFNKTGYSKETGAQGTLQLNQKVNFEAMGWTQEAIEETENLIAKWNQGQRWI